MQCYVSGWAEGVIVERGTEQGLQTPVIPQPHPALPFLFSIIRYSLKLEVLNQTVRPRGQACLSSVEFYYFQLFGSWSLSLCLSQLHSRFLLSTLSRKHTFPHRAVSVSLCAILLPSPVCAASPLLIAPINFKNLLPLFFHRCPLSDSFFIQCKFWQIVIYSYHSYFNYHVTNADVFLIIND